MRDLLNLCPPSLHTIPHILLASLQLKKLEARFVLAKTETEKRVKVRCELNGGTLAPLDTFPEIHYYHKR